jgi:hypothetical protein
MEAVETSEAVAPTIRLFLLVFDCTPREKPKTAFPSKEAVIYFGEAAPKTH